MSSRCLSDDVTNDGSTCGSASAADLRTVENFDRLLEKVLARQYAVGQVRPVEVADEDDRLLQGELTDDVGPHLFRRRGSVAVDGRAGEELAQAGEHAILGAKIVPPVAY